MDLFLYTAVAVLVIKAFFAFRNAERKLGGMPKTTAARRNTRTTRVGNTVFGH